MDFKNNYDRYWKRFTCSFIYAWTGLKHAIRHEQNMKIHILIATIMISFAFILKIPLYEKLILLLVIGIVISLEVINTAIERVVDLVTKEYHPMAKIAKDVSAGAVLIFSFFTVVIGILIFYRPIVEIVKALL
ncbi:diacylglycerol kinase family protein [Anaerobacillus isosaccharinicus]|uniref:Diacylglycerol kinase family protein n=1 Tax=Anaerobacillus isosaccharinicus TaxID=1532552 RepID=A0A1S2LR57_9BACI|nr:diacylglycerol kinase family protein [Anaerobacillus isosaccharinicus]MBA5585503.1 diacylglycerol kinase family protein [Anaerobacillus isosaccharinicus]QOY36183.1 diacylglycerol kinase family protein [Anaerobacillus isosaccharinicus]